MEDEYDEGYVLVEKPEAAAGDAAADAPPAPSTPLLSAEKTAAPAPALQPGVLEVVSAGLCAWLLLVAERGGRCWAAVKQAAALVTHDATSLAHRYARAIQAHDWQGLRALSRSQLLRVAHTAGAAWRAARSAATTYCHSAASLAAWALHHPSECGRCTCHALWAAYSRVDPQQRLPRAAARLAERAAELWHKADPDGKVGKAFHSYITPALSLAAHRASSMACVARPRLATAWSRMAPVLQRAWVRARRACASRGSSWLLVVAVAMGVLAIFIDTMLDL